MKFFCKKQIMYRFRHDILLGEPGYVPHPLRAFLVSLPLNIASNILMNCLIVGPYALIYILIIVCLFCVVVVCHS